MRIPPAIIRSRVRDLVRLDAIDSADSVDGVGWLFSLAMTFWSCCSFSLASFFLCFLVSFFGSGDDSFVSFVDGEAVDLDVDVVLDDGVGSLISFSCTCVAFADDSFRFFLALPLILVFVLRVESFGLVSVTTYFISLSSSS